MKKLLTGIVLMGTLTTLSSCKKWLDVNRNPNGPDAVAANLYLGPMLQGIVNGEQFDGRYVGKYVQNWAQNTDKERWDSMGYLPTSDTGGEMWRANYWLLGQNLIDMMRIAEEENRYDMLGLGYVIKALGYQKSTALHGEIIVTEAYTPGKTNFKYDSQEIVYQEIDKLLALGIENLERTDGAVSSSFMSKGDNVYRGNREKWLKFAYGLRAITLNHLTNKSALYDPRKVIEYVDKSFASSADDALFSFPGGTSPLSNFWGQRRGNLDVVRQTRYIVSLLNGTIFGSAAPDPRLSRMLQPSPNGKFNGLQPTYTAATTYPIAADRPNSFFGTVGAPTATSPGRYLFDDKAKYPMMTYSQLQFVKAEAAILANDKVTALDAYKKGIEAHMKFVNDANATTTGGNATVITPAEIAAFMADVNVVPVNPADLTLKHVMSQKYIAQYVWGVIETWVDLRRYHYTDIDPATGKQVFEGFEPVEVSRLYGDNLGKLAYRLRPRYNSEYIWNVDALKAIGGMDVDFHTKEPWAFKP